MHLNSRKTSTAWRLLNNKANVEQIRKDIKRFVEENDTGDVDPAILWYALKAVICRKLIGLTMSQKRPD